MALTQRVTNLPRRTKRGLALLVDAALCVITVWLAFVLRLDEPVILFGPQYLAVVASIMLALPLFIVTGLYRAIFRYAGWPALMAVARACGIYGVLYSAIFTANAVPEVPRSVGIIQPLLLFLAVGGSRAFARYWLTGSYRTALGSLNRTRVIIYGAGAAGRQLAAGIAGSADMQVVGFVDDDRTLTGSILHGLRIYPPEQLPELIDRLSIAEVMLAVPSATRRRRTEIVASLHGQPVHIKTLPSFMELARGKVTISDLRDLDIEDLLGRDPVAPDLALFQKNIAGKTVLVTGAGGSIGGELCRQILTANPARILLVDASEPSLYAINEELRALAKGRGLEPDLIVPLLASVTDRVRLLQIMTAWRPATVYHAAAYKHVPMVEHNPGIGIRNNLFGTCIAAEVAAETGVADFVLISTDKAVRPTNFMGASKRAAELVLQALAQRGSDTRFSMVRFGNVLGSSGSVVPLFRKQIREGGPVTITHQDITRYFMTIPEAAQLVIQAGAMAEGGEVFVLDMGSPVRIIDLAHKMIELSGLTVRDEANPLGDIEIEVVGLRPGEKLYEELLIGDNPAPTSHQRIMKANEKRLDWAEVNRRMDALDRAIEANDTAALRAEMLALVPEFTPEARDVDWIAQERVQSPVADVISLESVRRKGR